MRKKKACETSSAASMGLQILVDPASSHMLVSKPFLKRSRAQFGPKESGDKAVTSGDMLGGLEFENRAQFPSFFSFLRPDSPPRFRLGVRQPAEVVRQPAELVTTEVTAPSGSVFGAKKR